jgi:NAD+ kinase
MSVCILHGRFADAGVIRSAIEILGRRGIEVWEADRDAPVSRITNRLKDATLVVTLGGDGTFLAGARIATPRGIPLLGVNLGRLGFLTELESEHMEEGFTRFFAGDYRIEERTVLQVTVRREDRNVTRSIGLNEVALVRTGEARMLRLEIDVGGQGVGVIDADGALVATATGSTAYALASGGPILEPTLRDLVLVPLNPFALTVRPIVFAPGQDITLSVLRGPADMRVDGGRRGRMLQTGDSVCCQSHPRRLRVVRFSPPESFYRRLGEKLGWGRPLVPMK